MRTVRIDDYPDGNPGYDKAESRAIVRRALGIFESNRVPYIFGVTPLLTSQEDIDFLNSVVKVGQVCQHGYTHKLEHRPWSSIVDTWPLGGEFAGMREWEIEIAHDSAYKIMRRIERFDPEQFIPPFNTYTQSALNVLAKKGVKKIHTCSKEWDAYGYSKLNYNGIQPIISPYQTLYDYAHKVVEYLRLNPFDHGQITLHWIFDKGHQGWEQSYQDICDWIKAND